MEDDLKVKIKKEDKRYDFIGGYGVFYNEWFLTSIEESLTEKLKEEPRGTDSLKHLIECQKYEMKDEEYEIESMYFFCINSEEDYKKDYYESDIGAYNIKECYVENNEFIIELC